MGALEDGEPATRLGQVPPRLHGRRRKADRLEGRIARLRALTERRVPPLVFGTRKLLRSQPQEGTPEEVEAWLRRAVIASALGSQRASGTEPDAASLAELEAFVRGELDLDQLRARARTRFLAANLQSDSVTHTPSLAP